MTLVLVKLDFLRFQRTDPVVVNKKKKKKKKNEANILPFLPVKLD